MKEGCKIDRIVDKHGLLGLDKRLERRQSNKEMGDTNADNSSNMYRYSHLCTVCTVG